MIITGNVLYKMGFPSNRKLWGEDAYWTDGRGHTNCQEYTVHSDCKLLQEQYKLDCRYRILSYVKRISFGHIHVQACLAIMLIARSCIRVLYSFATAMNGRRNGVLGFAYWRHSVLRNLLGFEHSCWLHIDFGFYLHLSNLYLPPFVEIPAFGWRKPHFCRARFPSCRSNSGEITSFVNFWALLLMNLPWQTAFLPHFF